MRILLSILICSVASAANFYVSPSGSNSNPGTEGSPFLTLDYALSRPALTAGDVIILAAGTYANSANTDISGSSGNPITIRGAGIGQTILTQKLTIDQAWYVVEDLTVDGFTNATGVYTGTYLSAMGSGCTDLVIRNCEFLRGVSGVNFQDETTPGSYPARVTIHDCLFHHFVGNGAVAAAGDDHEVYGCTFRDSVNDAIRVNIANDAVFRNNTFERINAPDIDGLNATSSTSLAIGTGEKVLVVEAGKSFTEFDQLTIYSALSPSTDNMTGFVTSYSGTALVVQVYSTRGSGTFDSWGITTGTDNDNGNHADIIQSFSQTLGTGEGANNISFHSSTITNCTSQFGNLENNPNNDASGDWFIYNNVFFGSRIQLNNYLPNVRIYNNTFYDSAGFTSGLLGSYSTNKGAANNMQIYNNLFIRMDGNSAGGGVYGFNNNTTGCSADYNIVTNRTDGAFISLNAGPNSINGGVTPDQLFTDVDTGDLTLASGSPAIGAGTDLSATFTTDINGDTRTVPWTIGAYISDEAPPAEPPAAPTDLAAVAAGAGQINLTWTDNAGDENGFKVERSPTGVGDWTQIATLGVDLEAYSDDDGLLPGTTYYYRVLAYNGAGDSDPSNTANATTTALGAGQPGTQGLLMGF